MNELRAAILQRLFTVQSFSRSRDLERIRTENADAILDAVIAAVPEAHLPEDFENYDGFPRGEIAGRFNATLDILKVLQSAKSKETK